MSQDVEWFHSWKRSKIEFKGVGFPWIPHREPKGGRNKNLARRRIKEWRKLIRQLNVMRRQLMTQWDELDEDADEISSVPHVTDGNCEPRVEAIFEDRWTPNRSGEIYGREQETVRDRIEHIDARINRLEALIEQQQLDYGLEED